LFQRVRFKKALERDTNSKEKIPLEEHTRLRSLILLRIQWPDLMRRGGRDGRSGAQIFFAPLY